MGYTSAGTSKLVARLEEKGLITRTRTRGPEDGRAFQVATTVEGERLLRAGLTAHVPRLDTDLVQRLTAAR